MRGLGVKLPQYYEFCNKTNYPLSELWGMAQFKCGLEFPNQPITHLLFFIKKLKNHGSEKFLFIYLHLLNIAFL